MSKMHVDRGQEKEMLPWINNMRQDLAERNTRFSQQNDNEKE